jgi:hypothetical protein
VPEDGRERDDGPRREAGAAGARRRTLPCGSTPAADVFQATTRASVSSIAALGAAVSYVPIIATPTVPLLKPPAWAPITARDSPPARPSQAVPKRSTRTL